MKKTVTLSNKQIEVIKESLDGIQNMPSDKLQPFIFKQVKTHSTSLGDNEAFPPDEDFPFDYKVLKERFAKVIENLTKIEDLESYEVDYLSNRLSKLLNECQEIEEPIRPNLEKICTNVILRLFDVPNDTVDFEASLVDKVEPEKQFRIEPEISSKRKFDFDSIDDFNNASKTVLKRRMVNALIQGASYSYSIDKDLFLHELYKIDKRLIDLYDEIIAINDYLLFVKEEKITDKNPMQGGCVEVMLGTSKEKTKIKAQGIIFPFLLHELIRGFLELFASHGLPEDNQKAKYIIGQADFLIAEPWDLRMGVRLWNYISEFINDTNVLPFFFMNLCSLPTEEFNSTLREVFAHTKKGQHLMKHLIINAEEELNGQGFVNNIDLKKAEVALINDDTYSSNDINTMIDEAMQINADKSILEYPNGKLFDVFSEREVESLLEPMFGKPIGVGSSRMAFEIDDYQVLKVAYGYDDEGAAGEKQNTLERQILTDKRHKNYSIFPKFLYGCPSDRWIVVEKVLPATEEDFEKILGICFGPMYGTYDFRDFIIDSWHLGRKKSNRIAMNKIAIEFINNNKEMKEIFNLVSSHRLLYGDLLRLENWGLTQRNGEPKLVLLDAGLNKEIHKEFY